MSSTSSDPRLGDIRSSMHKKNAALRTELQHERSKVQELQAAIDCRDAKEDYSMDIITEFDNTFRDVLEAGGLPLGPSSKDQYDFEDILDHIRRQVPVLETLAASEKLKIKDLQEDVNRLEAEVANYQDENALQGHRLQATFEILQQEVRLGKPLLERSQWHSMNNIKRAINACMAEDAHMTADRQFVEVSPVATQIIPKYRLRDLYNLRKSQLSQQETDQKWYLCMMIRNLSKGFMTLERKHLAQAATLEHRNLTLINSVADVDIPRNRFKCAVKVDRHSPVGDPFRSRDNWRIQFGSNAGDLGHPYVSLTFEVKKTDPSRPLSHHKKTQGFTLRISPTAKDAFVLKNLKAVSLDDVPQDLSAKAVQNPCFGHHGNLCLVSLVGKSSLPVIYKYDTFDGLEEVQANFDALFRGGSHHKIDIWFVHPDISERQRVNMAALALIFESSSNSTLTKSA